jgi:hypothetical protein
MVYYGPAERGWFERSNGDQFVRLETLNLPKNLVRKDSENKRGKEISPQQEGIYFQITQPIIS